MARPTQPRRIRCRFGGRGFRPIGRPGRDFEVAVLALDELEAIRLADVEGLYQEAAAQRMGVSRATFARILNRGRTTVAQALLEEQALVLGDGPVVEAEPEPLPCPVHEGGRRRGRGCCCRRRQWASGEGDDRGGSTG